MFDGEQYGKIPLMLQNYILYVGLEHPCAKLVKDIKLPEVIFSKYDMCFYEHFLMFNDFKWKSSISFVDYTNSIYQ